MNRLSLCHILLFAALPGCASLDPAADIDGAAGFVAERSAIEPAWTEPWSEPADAWDGRSPLAADVAVRVALQNNRSLRREVETIVAARADYVQAHLLPNPIINLAVGFPTDGLGGQPIMAGAVQQLAWLWRRPTAIDGADADLQARVLAVSDTAIRVAADVRRAHGEVHYSERALSAQTASTAQLRRAHELLESQLEAGEASRLDLNRIELMLRAADIKLADRRAAHERSKRNLLELIGRAADSVDWTTCDTRPITASELDEQSVIALALAQRLDIAAAEAVIESRRAGVDLAELGRLPDVSAGVSYQQNFGDRPALGPAVTVTPKLFDDNSARVARAMSALRQAEIEADRVRQSAISEARQAWVVLEQRVSTVHTYEQAVLRLAEQNHALTRIAFEAGEIDATQLLEAERHLSDARAELADRRLQAHAQLIELERAVGGSLTWEPAVAENAGTATLTEGADA